MRAPRSLLVSRPIAAGNGRSRFCVGGDRNSDGAATFIATSALLNPEDDPDVQLMLAVQRGDDSAFRQLFEKHVGGLVGFAVQFVGVRARAEELAQDVFLQVYRMRMRYAPRARFATWLYRMLTNACLTEMRRVEYRVRVQPVEGRPAVGDDPASALDTLTPSAEDALLSRESLDSMQRGLGALPPQQRAALLLARVEGMSYEEVAATLSCSVSAVKSLIHRATVSLRERVREVTE